MLIIYLLYSLISIIILVLISKISYKLDLVDKPNKRKKHKKPTAFTGGVGLSLIYILSIFLFDVRGENLNLILSIALLITLVGFIDDIFKLNVGGKLSLQIIPIIYLIVQENLNLIQLGDYNYFQLELNTFSIPFTLLSVMFLINSTNYFDGLDGTLGITILSVLSILYFLIPDENLKLFIIVIIIPILFFLFFNFAAFKLPKMFLGDGGSLLLGFILSFTLIFIGNEKLIHPILLAWSISIFVYEFLSINLIRLKNRINIFQSGMDHLHHILHIRISSLFLVNLIISSTNITFFFIGYISFVYINSLVSLILFIILFIIYFYLRLKLLNKYQ